MGFRLRYEDPRLKNLDITAKYSMVNAAFGYPKNAVVCVLVKGQYLLMPEASLMPNGSLAQMATAFSALPDDLKLRVGNERIEVGRLHQSIREAALNRPKVPALATWSEIMPRDSKYYQLITSEDKLTMMWIDRYFEDSKIEPTQSFGIILDDIVISCIDHDMHGFTAIGDNRAKFTGVVKLNGDCSLYSVYSTWDCTNWVWSQSKRRLVLGNPGLHSLPGFRD